MPTPMHPGDYRLRANPDYRIVPLADLDAETRASLGPLLGEGVAGLLQPSRAGGTIKALDEPGLRLLAALAAPGPLPDDLRPADPQGEAALAALILDGILELATGDGFVSGPAAYATLYGPTPELDPAGPLAGRTLAALQLASGFPLPDPLTLSGWLYGYGRRPLTAAWRQRLHSAAATEAFLGLAEGGEARALLDRHWRRGGEHPAWLTWSPRGRHAGATRFKLYLSPRTEELPTLLRAMLGVFARHDPPPFKIGRDAANLLRPDKLVAYFASRDELDAAIRALRPALAGLTADGVPFTAPCSADGLLSWGIDPPAETGTELASRESWRLWLTNRLALALVAARGAAGMEPWQFALARLSLAGIDPRSWVPGEVNWAA